MNTNTYTALITPFKNNKLDEKAFEKIIKFQIENGIDGIVPCGTTGESPTLSHEEHERVIGEVIQWVAGRCKVMAGTGSNSTAEALRLTKRAAKEGADASLQVATYYNKPMQEGFYQHFKRIAEEVGIPHCVYNIPGRSAKNIEPETIARLAEIPNITMVKEATGSLDQCSQILNTTSLTVLSGDDSLTLPMMSIGAEGVISVAGNLVPSDLLKMLHAAGGGDYRLAAEWHHRLFSLCRDMLSLATNPIPIKEAMAMLGRDTGELRLPMTPLEPSQREKLASTLDRYGLPVRRA